MAIASNAEEWALPRRNIFFKTVYAALEGQCVTLVKCFMEDMTDVPNPHAARGDARYVGQKLVAEGLAVKVPYAERRRGDIAVFEYGVYGHIGVMLDDDKIFEENVNVGAVRRKLITDNTGSWYVYASRIGRLSEAWRPMKPVIYRIKSYKEGEMKTTAAEATYLERILTMNHTPTAAQIKAATGVELLPYLKDRYNDGDFVGNKEIVKVKYPAALKKIKELEAQLASGGVELKPGTHKFIVKG